MNDKILKRIIQEELQNILKEGYINPEQLTPEQKKIRDDSARKLLSDPTFQQLLEKYGLFANLDIFKGLGLVTKDQ